MAGGAAVRQGSEVGMRQLWRSVVFILLALVVGQGLSVLAQTPGQATSNDTDKHSRQVLGNNGLSEWQSVATMITPRQSFASVAVHGFIFALGGMNDTGDLDSVERAKINPDGTLGPWQSVASMPSARRFAAAVVSNNTIYVLGGSVGAAPAVATVDRATVGFDGSLSWESAAPMTTPRDGLTAVAIGGHIYALGGYNGQARLNTVERASVNPDGSLASWQSESSMTQSRYQSAAVAFNDRIYVLGGLNSLFSVEQAEVRQDGSLGEWQPGTPMTTPRAGLGAFVLGGHLAALGGYDSSTNWFASVEQAPLNTDGSWGAWQAASTMSQSRVYMATVTVGGRIYALGGWSPFSVQNSVERAESDPPLLTGFSPSAVRSDQDTTVLINGANILQTPIVKLNDHIDLASEFVSSTAVTAIIPANQANGWYTATLINGDGRTAMLTYAVRIDGPGPVVVGDYSLSINDGSLFTNRTSVSLTIGSRADTAQIQVSNDGGFGNAEWEVYTSHKSWQLLQHGDYAIPRTVYVRFKDIFGNTSAPRQDDIVLDVTPPTGTVQVLTSAWARFRNLNNVPSIQKDSVNGKDHLQYSHIVHLPLIYTDPCSTPPDSATVILQLDASDDVSGVGEMMIDTWNDFRCSSWQPYVTTKAWAIPKDAPFTVYARFRDRAGNISDIASDSVVIPVQKY